MEDLTIADLKLIYEKDVARRKAAVERFNKWKAAHEELHRERARVYQKAWRDKKKANETQQNEKND
jgi:hypothetical protein